MIFAIYLILLCWLVLFKFALSPAMIPNMRGINLKPFRYALANMTHLKEVIYNVLVFIPAGVYFSAIFARKNILLGTVSATLLSLIFETAQWIFSIGVSDITDLITNTGGGFLGMLLFWIMGKIAFRERMKIFNTLGVMIEVAGILMLMVFPVF